MLPNTDELRRLAQQLRVKREGYLAFSFRHYALAHVRKMNEMLYNQACEVGLAKAQQEQVGYQDYVSKVEQERDELRSQVATLHQAIDVTIKRWYDTKDCTLRIDELYRAVDLVSTDRSAQYVRGLEAALQSWATAYESGTTFENETILRRLMRQTREALAAKEDRG